MYKCFTTCSNIPTIETNIKYMYAITASFEHIYSGIRVATPLCKACSPTAAAFGCAHTCIQRDFVPTIAITTKPAGGAAMHSDKASSADSFR